MLLWECYYILWTATPVFSCFHLFFVMIPLIGNTVVWVLLYSVDRNPPVSFNRSLRTLSVYELWCIYQNNIYFFEDCGLWVTSCWKSTTLFLFLMHLYSSSSNVDPEKLIDEEGHQLHVSADTCTCKSVVKQISSQDHTPCQWVFGKTFTGTTFLETGAWNLVW